jgi:flagellar biogenesis protein FliO
MIKLYRLLAAPAFVLALALPCFAADTGAAAPAASAPASASAGAPRTAIPFKHEKQSDGSLGFQALAALVLAGLAAYGIAYALKHYGMKGAAGGLVLRQRRVKTLESTRLGRRSVLHVIEYEGEQLLLAETEQKLEVLSRRPTTPQAGAPDA